MTAQSAHAFDPFEAAPDPMALLAADGSVLRANTAFRAAFKHWVGPGRPPWGRVQPPAFKDELRRFDASAPDGRHLEWIERRLPDGATLVAAREITARDAAAEEAARAKTTLFATLTHELRTPLNGILGMAGLLADSQLDASQRTHVAAIHQSGEHLLDLITEILDYARLEAGRVVLEAQPFDPEATLQSVAELLSPKAHAKGLEITVLIRAGTPTRVIGDDGRLRQILFNLAGNAVKFTQTGGVVLEMIPTPTGMRLAVSDTGPGVAPDMQTRIFEEFAQAEGSSRQHGGAGLGLAIVKRLAHAMGGAAGLVSRPGHGARFWVDLPFERAPGGAQHSLAGLTVAVASPSRVLTQALTASLEAMGARIAAPGAKADAALVDATPQLSVMEIDALKLRSRAVIALVPQEDRGGIARTRALGVGHYVIKPIRRASLVQRIRIALGETGPHGEDEEDRTAPRALIGARVLLAEDNPINALLARTLLSRAGCIVEVVSDGEEAVAAVAHRPFDLVFLDLRMPRLDGFGAARRIRALDGPGKDVPLIALTAEAGEEDRAAVLAAGMNDFVTKPIDAVRLASVAARFTGKAKAAAVHG